MMLTEDLVVHATKKTFPEVLSITPGVYRLWTWWWAFGIRARIRVRSEGAQIRMSWYVGGDNKTPADKIKRIVFSNEGEVLSYEERDDIGVCLIYFKSPNGQDSERAEAAAALFIGEVTKSIEGYGVPNKD